MRRLLDNKDITAFVAPSGSGPVLAVVDMVAADGRPMCNAQAQTPTIIYPNGRDQPPTRVLDERRHVVVAHDGQRLPRVGGGLTPHLDVLGRRVVVVRWYHSGLCAGKRGGQRHRGGQGRGVQAECERSLHNVVLLQIRILKVRL